MGSELERAKQALRRQLSRRRRALPREAAEAAGRAVLEHLGGCPSFRAARCVALYAALPDELPTRPCFEDLRARDVETLLPRLGDGTLSFHVVLTWEELRPGRYGLLEPPPRAPMRSLAEADLVLVPGVAFDLGGNRLGRGGGHYDAVLPVGAGKPPLFGVGYQFQVVSEVPHGAHDRRVDGIVTEAGIRWVGR